MHSTCGRPAPELSLPGASDQCLRPGPRGRGGRGTLAMTGCVLGRCVCVCVPPWPLALPPSTARSVRLCGHRQGLRPPPPVPAHLSGPPLTSAQASGTQALKQPATRAMSQTRLRSTAPVRSAGMPPTAVTPAPHPHAPHYTPSVPVKPPALETLRPAPSVLAGTRQECKRLPNSRLHSALHSVPWRLWKDPQGPWRGVGPLT